VRAVRDGKDDRRACANGPEPAATRGRPPDAAAVGRLLQKPAMAALDAAAKPSSRRFA
jgi:hypothetical protein